MSDPVSDPLGAGASRSAPAGPLLFARYAYPPNELGYCGPSDPGALLESASDGLDLAELAHLATGFAGAWPYLELIAGCNGIADPLDARVVEAYWVGNPLLEKVSDAALLSSLSDRFEDRAGRRFGHVASAVPLGGVCQHSFHVFAVYPWLGLLRAGMEGAPSPCWTVAVSAGATWKQSPATWSPCGIGCWVSTGHGWCLAQKRWRWCGAACTAWAWLPP